MERPMILEPDTYVDYDKLPKLVEYVTEFTKQDMSKFWVDVGEKNVGESINWYSIIVIPHGPKDAHWTYNAELEEKAKHIIEYVKNMAGVERFAINILKKVSLIPIHLDDDTRPEYDNSGRLYNLLIPLNDNGWSLVDGKMIKNQTGVALVFDGQLPHGGMNDTLDTRTTIFLNVNKQAFNVNT